jgi:hypothetical protein
MGILGHVSVMEVDLQHYSVRFGVRRLHPSNDYMHRLAAVFHVLSKQEDQKLYVSPVRILPDYQSLP